MVKGFSSLRRLGAGLDAATVVDVVLAKEMKLSRRTSVVSKAAGSSCPFSGVGILTRGAGGWFLVVSEGRRLRRVCVHIFPPWKCGEGGRLGFLETFFLPGMETQVARRGVDPVIGDPRL